MKLFNQEQLQMICTQAELCLAALSGELSVVEAVERANRQRKLFTPDDLNILAFLAEGVRRQDENKPEIRVYWYATAWDRDYTFSLESRIPTVEQEMEIFRMIEPEEVHRNYRCVPIMFRNGTWALAPELIPSAMYSLFTRGLQVLEPQDAYVEYEKIHPHVNGNGRYGFSLYNRLRGSMLKPEFPVEPEHFASRCASETADE